MANPDSRMPSVPKSKARPRRPQSSLDVTAYRPQRSGTRARDPGSEVVLVLVLLTALLAIVHAIAVLTA